VEGLTNIKVDCTKKIASFDLVSDDFDYETVLNDLAESTPTLQGWSLK
jgi:hypothetical protein